MPDTASRWLVHFAGREPVEVTCAPAADLALVLRTYPDAIAAEPAQSCRRCAHFTRPGLSSGYCGAGVLGLVLAYGYLSALPADRGAACDEFAEVGP